MTRATYKVGDRVCALRWPRDASGAIVKPAPVYPLVRWDGFDEIKRVRSDEIRPENSAPRNVAPYAFVSKEVSQS